MCEAADGEGISSLPRCTEPAALHTQRHNHDDGHFHVSPSRVAGRSNFLSAAEMDIRTVHFPGKYSEKRHLLCASLTQLTFKDDPWSRLRITYSTYTMNGRARSEVIFHRACAKSDFTARILGWDHHTVNPVARVPN